MYRALFKGRICLIHAFSDSHISFFNKLFINVYKYLNLQFIVPFAALIGLMTSTVFVLHYDITRLYITYYIYNIALC